MFFDKNVPVGVRRFLIGYEVRTFAQMQWHLQLENGELLTTGDADGFDVMVTSDQNTRYQQNLTGRKLVLAVLGSNIWPIVREQFREVTRSSGCLHRGGRERSSPEVAICAERKVSSG
jgi:hypothetical protein